MFGFNPFKEMDDLRREIDNIFHGYSRPGNGRFTAFLPGQSARSYPRVNLHEDADNYYAEALAPGIDPQKLNISVTGNLLTISGEKTRSETDVKPESYHRSERAAGRFVRSIELPTEVNHDNTSAEYKNGFLTITLPKAEEVKPKRIEVKVS